MSERGRRRYVKEHGLLYYIGLGLSFGLLALVLLLAGAVVLVPAVSGSTPYTILTSSMEPSMPPGTLVIVKPIDPQDIRIGTVVTYQLYSGEKDVVTHRVLEIQGPTLPGGDPSFITKGDANSEPDAKPVMSIQVRGAVWYSVPWIGWVNNLVNGDMRAVVIPIVAGLLFLYAGWSIVGNQIDRRRRRRREEAQDAEDAVARARQATVAEAVRTTPDYVPADLGASVDAPVDYRFPSGS
ncbi:MAG: signal peptidase [Schumannella sp.]|nr:signal peptidase [Schumannella sp.]